MDQKYHTHIKSIDRSSGILGGNNKKGQKTKQTTKTAGTYISIIPM